MKTAAGTSEVMERAWMPKWSTSQRDRGDYMKTAAGSEGHRDCLNGTLVGEMEVITWKPGLR